MAFAPAHRRRHARRVAHVGTGTCSPPITSAAISGRARLLIEENLPLVRSLACRFAGHGEQVDDLVQVGSIGLIKSVDRFRVGQGELASYAVPMIVGEIRRHLRDRAAPVRRPREPGAGPASTSPARRRRALRLRVVQRPSSSAASSGPARREPVVARRSRPPRARPALLRRPQPGPYRRRGRHLPGTRLTCARPLDHAAPVGASVPLGERLCSRPPLRTMSLP